MKLKSSIKSLEEEITTLQSKGSLSAVSSSSMDSDGSTSNRSYAYIASRSAYGESAW